MRILLDNNIDHRFLKFFDGYSVEHVQKIGWDKLKNGDLITSAENAGYDALITADKNLQYQQNLKGRKISILVLSPLFVDFQGTKPLIPQIMMALDNLPQGSFIKIEPEKPM